MNNNGHISFTGPFFAFNPQQFPFPGIPLIAIYWADADTRDNTTGGVWYRETDNKDLVSEVKAMIEQAYPYTAQDFSSRFIFVATWDHVGYYPMRTDKVPLFIGQRKYLFWAVSGIITSSQNCPS